MKYSLTYLLFIIFFLCKEHKTLSSPKEISFVSKKYEQIYGQLPKETKEILGRIEWNNLRDTILSVKISENLYKLHIGFDFSSRINHIGLMIYDKEKIDNSVSVIALFVERILLEYLLSTEKKKFFKNYEKKSIYFRINGLTPLYQLETILTLENTSTFKAQIDSSQIVIQLPINNLNTLEIQAANDIGLLKAMDKIELELELIKQLQQIPRQALINDFRKDALFETYKGSFFFVRGNIYENDSLINANTFYTNDGFDYKPLNNPDYKKETLNNIFQLLIASDQLIQVNPILYNESNPVLEINLTDFAAFFHDDYEVYLGWQKESSEQLTGSLFFKHKYFMHKHLLEFYYLKKAAPMKSCTMKGKLFLFIPNKQL